jgi:hypothetical protein
MADNADGPGMDDNDGWVTIDPATAAAAGSGGTGGGNADAGSDQPKRRGRKPGSRNTPKEESGSGSLAGLEIKDILLSAHSMLALALKNPLLELSEDEAKKLDKAIKRVSRHYPVNVSQKHVDIGYAIYTVGAIYGTRAIAIMAQSKMSNKTPQQTPPRDPSVLPFAAPTGGY